MYATPITPNKQECLIINAACHLTDGFEHVLPDYVEVVERPAGACRRRHYLVCPGCKAVRETERGRALSSPATHPKSCSNYFLTFAFLARAADP